MVVSAKPRERRSAGKAFAIAAFNGPMLMKSRSSVTNIAGQKTNGFCDRTAGTVKRMETTSDTPDSVK